LRHKCGGGQQIAIILFELPGHQEKDTSSDGLEIGPWNELFMSLVSLRAFNRSG